jgi:hypothetical protein
MAFNDLETKRIEKAIDAFMKKRRPPPHIRPKLDFGHRIKGHSVELFTTRPFWRDPKEKIESAIAKATYVRTTAIWKVFWQRADLKWYSYPPVPQVGSIEKFLEIVAEDKHNCFFG